MQGGEDLSVAELSRVAPPKKKRARPLNEAEKLGAQGIIQAGPPAPRGLSMEGRGRGPAAAAAPQVRRGE